MLIVGYCFGIRSERRLCEEVHLNLAYRWFCRLGLDGDVPDHSSFSKNRRGRFRDSDLLRHIFETVVRRCMTEGLVGGDGFAVDASLIKADANRQRGIDGSAGLSPEASSRAIDEYMAFLDNAAFGAATEVTPKFISPADPAARWTGAHGGQAFFAYSANYLIDLITPSSSTWKRRRQFAKRRSRQPRPGRSPRAAARRCHSGGHGCQPNSHVRSGCLRIDALRNRARMQDNEEHAASPTLRT